MKSKDPIRPPLKSKLPEEVVEDLLTIIRHQFYPDAPAEAWSCDAYFIKVRVILWPATFMVGKGFAMRPERYLEIMREVLRGIQQHGQTEGIKHWPRYLTVCVQRHFAANWETYYNEAKCLRNQADAVLMALQGAQRDPGETFIEAMNLTHRLLTMPKKRKQASAPKQIDMFS